MLGGEAAQRVKLRTKVQGWGRLVVSPKDQRTQQQEGSGQGRDPADFAELILSSSCRAPSIPQGHRRCSSLVLAFSRLTLVNLNTLLFVV